MSGVLIAFEGGEGSGKSTQARLLAEAIGALLTHEPGATPLGGQLRRVLLDPAGGPMDPRAEALLMAADRAEHFARVVEPALADGRTVVTDRSAYSSLAYQAYGRELVVDEVRRLSEWATKGRWPDVVLLLSVSPAEAATRVASRASSERGPDRMEAESVGFHQRVRAGFEALAALDPRGWRVVDGAGDIAAVAARVRAAWEEWRAGAAV